MQDFLVWTAMTRTKNLLYISILLVLMYTTWQGFWAGVWASPDIMTESPLSILWSLFVVPTRVLDWIRIIFQLGQFCPHCSRLVIHISWHSAGVIRQDFIQYSPFITKSPAIPATANSSTHIPLIPWWLRRPRPRPWLVGRWRLGLSLARRARQTRRGWPRRDSHVTLHSIWFWFCSESRERSAAGRDHSNLLPILVSHRQ